MKRIVIPALIAGTLSSFAIAHEGHEHATGVVRERMEAMTSMGEDLLAMSKRLRENKDLGHITDDARKVYALAAKLPGLFPPGSTQAPTAAKAEVWSQWPDFQNKAKALEVEAERLMNTNPADGAALRKQFRTVAFTCDRCHEAYRVTKQK